MKAFRFPLQAVLTLREQAEQTAQQQCAAAYAVVRAAATRLRIVNAAIAASEDARRAQFAAGTTADQVEQSRRYAVLLDEHRARLGHELAEACRHAEEAWQQLVAATQRREALERLRGRQRRLHDYQSARAEQKLLDELAGRGPTLAETWRGAFTEL